eukprot:jgi/Psemu1/292530/fgenesh1_pg.1110_\
MPHLQDEMAEQKHLKQSGVGGKNGVDSSLSRREELPIQVARPNFLGSCDPDVAMAKKVSAAVVEPSFDSVTSFHRMSSPAAREKIKNVITPSSSIGQIISTQNSSATVDVSSTESESTPVTEVYGNPSTSSSHSLIMVKRRISRSEDEECSPTSKQQQPESSSLTETWRPAIIRRGSSLALGKRTWNYDTQTKELLQSTAKKLKIENKSDVVVDDTTASVSKEGANAVEAATAAAASAMAEMKDRKPDTSAVSLGGKASEAMDGKRHLLPFRNPSHLIPHQGFHPGVVAPPPFHPHMASFPGHTFGPNGAYPMVYPGYPPHAPPGAVHPMMVAPFHGHPSHGFYPYPPAYHQHPMNQRGGQHVHPFAAPYQQMPSAALTSSKRSSSIGTKNADSELDRSVNSTATDKSGAGGKPVSTNRCVPLQDPIPSKHWGKAETTKNVVLPDFHRLVNYPAYLSKSRGLASGDASLSKAVAGKKHCVMCGKLRVCSASNLTEKGRATMSCDDGSAHIIPRQNKGLCTACDVTVWVMVADGLEIKWCKGCKNFRQWAAFGEKGSATKCVRCRERQREKYAMQKGAKRARRTSKNDTAIKNNASTSTPSSSSLNQRIGSTKKEEPHFAAAKGLTSLMNAAATL